MNTRLAIFSAAALLALGGCSSLPGQYADASAGTPCNQSMGRTHQRVQAGNLLYTVSEDFSGMHPAITPASFQTVAEYDSERNSGCK